MKWEMVQYILYKSEPIENRHLLNLRGKQHIVTDSRISEILHTQLQFNKFKFIDQLDYPW